MVCSDFGAQTTVTSYRVVQIWGVRGKGIRPPVQV